MSDRRTVWTARDLLDHDFPEPRWAVPGIIAEGLNLLAGAPKVGKSWLALNLAWAVASGGTALGSVPVDRGKVLQLSLEDTGRRLQHRLKLILDGEPCPDGLTVATEWPRVSDGGADRIGATLEQHPDIRLVICDVLQRFRDPTPTHGSVYAADYAALEPLKALADRHSVAVLVLHHVRKAGSDDFLDTVSGTHGLAGAADTVLVLQRARGQADAELHVTGRDVEERTYALRTDPAWRPVLLDGPADEWRLSETRKAILDALRDTDVAMTPKEVAEYVGISHDAARQTCVRMAKAEQIIANGDGTYEPPPPPLSQPSHLSLVTEGGSDSSDSSDR